MTYSDDKTSPSSAPFVGDPTGDVLNEPENFVAQSPLTTVRMVETQSGFLVVLKDVDDRLSLSVKRKIGTPPASHVLLTSDESLKLSRILSNGEEAQSVADYKVTGALDQAAQPQTNDAISTLTAETHQTTDFSDLSAPSRRERDAYSPRRAKEKKYLLFGGIGLVAAFVMVVVAAVYFFMNYTSTPPATDVKEIVKNEMSSENVDTFVRTFVSNLLDFSPRSYRYSQIQAMAVMKPDLMKKYWNETNFPISRRQLKRLPKNQTVLISKIVQEPTSSVSTDVDLYGELVSPSSKKPSPIHLKLGISLNQDGKLVVVSQKDVSTSK